MMVIQRTKAAVVQMNPLTDTILQLILAPEQYIDYQAGQYLQLLLGDTALPFSIANAPLGTRKYELHIRHTQENPTSKWLLDEIKQQGFLNLSAPYGECDYLHLDAAKPIIFIAAGTGFAPVNAMIEQLLAHGSPPRFELIWTARTQSDLYLDEKVKQWQNHVHQFKYTPLLSTKNKKTPFSILWSQHAHDLHHWQIVLSGSFEMVYKIRDQLIAQGVPRHNLYSDAFQFEEKS